MSVKSPIYIIIRTEFCQKEHKVLIKNNKLRILESTLFSTHDVTEKTGGTISVSPDTCRYRVRPDSTVPTASGSDTEAPCRLYRVLTCTEECWVGCRCRRCPSAAWPPGAATAGGCWPRCPTTGTSAWRHASRTAAPGAVVAPALHTYGLIMWRHSPGGAVFEWRGWRYSGVRCNTFLLPTTPMHISKSDYVEDPFLFSDFEWL